MLYYKYTILYMLIQYSIPAAGVRPGGPTPTRGLGAAIQYYD